jgi:hypothetical protein
MLLAFYKPSMGFLGLPPIARDTLARHGSELFPRLSRDFVAMSVRRITTPHAIPQSFVMRKMTREALRFRYPFGIV